MQLSKRQRFVTDVLYFIPVLIIIGLLSVSIGLNADEPFTLNLIHHSYSQLIYIDSFDVHPPLYYLSLKLFLQITTFWTNSIIVKIIFARIFSLITFAITFYFLVQILNLVGVDINWKIQLALYLVFPSILYYSADIRMYQLATMFIVLEIYGLLLFKYKNNNKGLILSCISLLLVLYTNYFAAMFAGAILLLSIIKGFFLGTKKRYTKLLVSGILDLFLFMPYMRILLHQVKYVSSNKYSNDGIDRGSKFVNICKQLSSLFADKPLGSKLSELFCLMFIIIEITLVIYILKNVNIRYKDLFIELLMSFIIGLIPSILLSLISHPMIEWRYGFPMFSIIYFFLISVVTNYIDNSNINKYFMCLFIILFSIILLYSFSSYKYDIGNDSLTINTAYNIDHNFNSHRNINAKYNSIDTSRIEDSSVFLLNKNKQVKAKHMNISGVLARNNRSLLKKVFSNIYLIGKSK